MRNEIPTPEPYTKLTFSTLGILSAVLAVIPICSLVYLSFLVGSSLASLVFLLLPSEVSIFDDYGPLILIDIVSVLLALFLGIIALRQRNRNRLFAVIGVTLSTLYILASCVFIIYVHGL